MSQNKKQRRVLIPTDLPPSAFSEAGSGLAVSVLHGTTMGTHWNVHALIPTHITKSTLEKTITSTFDLVITQMSHWDPTSELSSFNNAPANSWHNLSPEFFTVLTRALEIAKITHGAFDPTIGKIVDLHGFGPTPPTNILPNITDLKSAKNHSGWQNIRFKPETLQAYQPGQHHLDLSSIAKGYAIDLAAEEINQLGINSFLIEIGGEFRGQGCKNDAQPWWVTIESTTPDSNLPETLAALCNLSIATSGNNIRKRTIENKNLSHLIDPKTSAPPTHELINVTVLSPTCMEADAWATALFISGPQKALKLAKTHNLPALLTTQTNGHLTQTESPKLKELLS